VTGSGGIQAPHPLRLPEKTFKVLPVTIWTAGIAIVTHIEDRDVCAVEDESSSIGDELKFDARAISAGRGDRPHYHKIPEWRAVCSGDADVQTPRGTRGKIRDRRLIRVRDTTGAAGSKGGWGSTGWETDDRLPSHIDADDLISHPAIAG
jgi:hypothetical protein